MIANLQVSFCDLFSKRNSNDIDILKCHLENDLSMLQLLFSTHILNYYLVVKFSWVIPYSLWKHCINKEKVLSAILCMNRKSDQMTTILEEMTWIIFGTNAATFSMLFLCSTWEDEKFNAKEINIVHLKQLHCACIQSNCTAVWK